MRSIAPVLALVALTACVTGETVRHDPNLGAENAAYVMLYRPNEGWIGAAVDHRAYAGAKYLGSIESGEAIGAFVKPGPTTIRVQGHTLGIPDGWPVKLELDLRAGERYYLRYSLYIDTITPLPTGAIVIGGTRFYRVSETAFKNRE